MQGMQQDYSTEHERGYSSIETDQSKTASTTTLPAGYRLALAISSLGALVLLCITIMGFLTNGGKTLLSLPALVLASVLIVTLSVAITAINFIFNYKH